MAFTGNKTHRFLIPARNSRHRIACLALYRALLRLAPQISLPNDLATGWGPGKNPITINIRRAFRRNVADMSPRIVHPALSAGYRMLTVLHGAATSPTSTHHSSIISFLESRLAERQRSLANRAPPPTGPKPGAPRPGTLPLLVRVSPAPSPFSPNPRIEYATPHRPRPQSELGGTGRRKIPRLDLASDFPFLRLTKPQPTLLSRVLRQKQDTRTARMEAMIDIREEQVPAAEEEDEWEASMAQLMRAEKRVARRDVDVARWEAEHDVGVSPEAGGTYVYPLRVHGIREMSNAITAERLDQVARADAMRRLIIQEKALAEKEKEQRAAGKRARWEAKMLELHGETWRDLFPNLKDNVGKSL